MLKRAIALITGALIVATGAVWAVPPTAPPAQIVNLVAFTSEIRSDLELLADNICNGSDERCEGMERPLNWTANIDNTTENYIPDLWYDKELLANEFFGEDVRPPGWFGITVDRPNILARNVRHDMEIIADQVFGANTRPPAWSGASQIFRCDRTVINIYVLATEFYAFAPEADINDFGFCTLVEEELRLFLLETRQLEIGGDDLDAAILSARGDLERLANEAFGVNERPINWSGNTDIDSPLLLTDTYADLNILTDLAFGEEDLRERPDGWVGLISESRVETWRNLRHDLEVLADAIVPNYPSIEGERPRGWENDDPSRVCSLRTQDLVLILEDQYNDEGASFNRLDYTGAEDYCATLNREANNFAEDPPLSEIDRLLAEGGALIYEAEFAFAYLDLTALEYMGVMPLGTRFRAWYRNFDESTMMFVSGEDFAVYIDRRWTTMPQDVFDRLPTLEGVQPLTFCDADWCNGPGPTPTPTGGALESLLAFETPVVAPPEEETDELPLDQKIQVNFDHVRIRYVQDNEQTRTSQVTLELCEDASLVLTNAECEPVIRVSDPTTGEPLPVIREQDAQNVYELPWGYNSFLIESATLVSNDIFLQDPTALR